MKEKIIDALAAGDYGLVARMAEKDRRVFSKLVALAYDKEDILCWRAIEAMGACAALVASHDPQRVRNVAQRLIWSAREESGGMGWSAPELLAEIACAAPMKFADIPPIIVSLHGEDEEKVFLRGVLRAIAKMGSAGIREIPGAAEVVSLALADTESEVRGLAIVAAERAEIEIGPMPESLLQDQGRLTIYENGILSVWTVAELAGRSTRAKT